MVYDSYQKRLDTTESTQKKQNLIRVTVTEYLAKMRQNAQIMRIWCICAHYRLLLRNHNSDQILVFCVDSVVPRRF